MATNMKPSRRGILQAFLGLPFGASIVGLADAPGPLKAPAVNQLFSITDEQLPKLYAAISDGETTIKFRLVDVNIRREMIDVTSHGFSTPYRQFMPGQVYREITGALDLRSTRQVGRWHAERSELALWVGIHAVRGLRLWQVSHQFDNDRQPIVRMEFS